MTHFLLRKSSTCVFWQLWSRERTSTSCDASRAELTALGPSIMDWNLQSGIWQASSCFSLPSKVIPCASPSQRRPRHWDGVVKAPEGQPFSPGQLGLVMRTPAHGGGSDAAFSRCFLAFLSAVIEHMLQAAFWLCINATENPASHVISMLLSKE